MSSILKYALASKAKVGKQQIEVNFSDEEIDCIADLRKLYLETLDLNKELEQDIYNMEKMFEKENNEIFNARNKILEEFKKNHNGDFSKFWLNVLKVSKCKQYISELDEKILIHLIDIRSKLYNEPPIKFVIEFHFEPNEYFLNKILTKTYYITLEAYPDEQFSYDGAKIYKCEGCHINWKNQLECDKITEADVSFFAFFSPPELPEDPKDEDYCDFKNILQSDFEIGFSLKEHLIPKAILFFTGEITDCQSSESESKSEVTDEVDSENSIENEK